MYLSFSIVRHRSGGAEETSYPRSIDPSNDPWYEIVAYKLGRRVGEMVLIKTKYGFYETHGEVMIHNRGIGSRMYAFAFAEARRRGIQVQSSRIRNQTDAARRLWQSKKLRRFAKIRRSRNRFRVMS